MFFITTSLLKNYDGMTIWPFLFVRHSALKKDAIFVNHERIHARQQKELLIIPFYIWYGFSYLWHRITKNHSRAYHSICFEREAYTNEHDLSYLKKRPYFNFLKF